MRGETSSPAWRLTALLLGASWVVTLAVACGGGGEDVVDALVTTSTVGSGSRVAASAGVVVSAAGQAPQAPPRIASAVATALVPPCTDASRQVAQRAALPTQSRASAAPADELSDEALNLPAGTPGTGAAHTQMADLSEATK